MGLSWVCRFTLVTIVVSEMRLFVSFASSRLTCGLSVWTVMQLVVSTVTITMISSYSCPRLMLTLVTGGALGSIGSMTSVEVSSISVLPSLCLASMWWVNLRRWAPHRSMVAMIMVSVVVTSGLATVSMLSRKESRVVILDARFGRLAVLIC